MNILAQKSHILKTILMKYKHQKMCLYVKSAYFNITFSGKKLEFINMEMIQQVVLMSLYEILHSAPKEHSVSTDLKRCPECMGERKAVFTWQGRHCDHKGGLPITRLIHHTPDVMTPALSPNTGN